MISDFLDAERVVERLRSGPAGLYVDDFATWLRRCPKITPPFCYHGSLPSVRKARSLMAEAKFHHGRCPDCQVEDHPDREIHRLMNLLLSRLDENHRRWYVALESLKIGHGGDRRLSLITGLNVETIRRGRRELADSLAGFPHHRIRRPGGGANP